MGQYYRPLLFKADEENCTQDSLLASFYSHDYKEGLKLMEHSWITGSLVCAVLCKIKELGKVRLVWAGDYADDELKRMCVKIKESQDTDKPLTVADFGTIVDEQKDWRVENGDDYKEINLGGVSVMVPIDRIIDLEIKEMLATPLRELKNCYSDNGVCLYSLCRESADVKSVSNPRANPRFILNHTKRQYVDIKHVKCEDIERWGDKWYIHPLPLLTCEGCGRGGGDYHQSPTHPSYKFIGLWARDIISVTNDKAETEGFEEIKPHFHEGE